jgi:glucose/arabinose dehydrogenase
MPDGALLVSDEHNGAIYRVSYSGRVAEGKR